MAKQNRTIKVIKTLRIQETQKGNTFLECNTDAGLAAFWGSERNMQNIQELGRHTVPFTLTCGCIDPNRKTFPSHDVWIPETSILKFVNAGSKS